MQVQLDLEGATQTATEYEQRSGSLTPRSSSVRPESPPLHPYSPSTLPKTIVLALWPGAQRQQIDYYVRGYAAVYPSAHVVPLHPSRTSPKHINAVVETLISNSAPDSSEANPDILIHAFGDEAALQVTHLLRAHHARRAQPLAVRALILDSVPLVAAPSYHTIRRDPLQLLLFVHLALLALLWRFATLLLAIYAAAPADDLIRSAFHDARLLPPEARRCYVFPASGVMFVWLPGGEEEMCERREFRARRGRVDEKGRWTVDQERYWLAIENAWEGR